MGLPLNTLQGMDLCRTQSIHDGSETQEEEGQMVDNNCHVEKKKPYIEYFQVPHHHYWVQSYFDCVSMIDVVGFLQ